MAWFKKNTDFMQARSDGFVQPCKSKHKLPRHELRQLKKARRYRHHTTMQEAHAAGNGSGVKVVRILVAVIAVQLLVVAGIYTHNKFFRDAKGKPVAALTVQQANNAAPAASQSASGNPALDNSSGNQGSAQANNGNATAGGLTASLQQTRAQNSAANTPVQTPRNTSSSSTNNRAGGARIEGRIPRGGIKHLVTSGENWQSIAASYGIDSEDLKSANTNVSLRSGVQIRIPSPEDKHAANTAETNQGESAGDSGKTYTVAKGDNVWSIAKKLKVDREELLKINGIKDPRKLQIGQQLKVPNQLKP